MQVITLDCLCYCSVTRELNCVVWKPSARSRCCSYDSAAFHAMSSRTRVHVLRARRLRADCTWQMVCVMAIYHSSATTFIWYDCGSGGARSFRASIEDMIALNLRLRKPQLSQIHQWYFSFLQLCQVAPARWLARSIVGCWMTTMHTEDLTRTR
ncbi:hypothetical protein DAEQUDRAFT_502975 [Daedalea quercina L-15889]|uniref:Uncharacterized protein n=1 Tax=Daedalea quercina L-15889 TaxID=1314783 RepID=A0A165T757_9APHY|nr:hypothetical protein DAEQUDRAFT_502975 [Daedalea quercina L-15889]